MPYDSTPGQMQGLVDRHLVTAAGQLARRGQASWARPDDGYALAGPLTCRRFLVRTAPGPVGDEALEVADGHRRARGLSHSASH